MDLVQSKGAAKDREFFEEEFYGPHLWIVRMIRVTTA
jgi:hypothetical protein